MANPQFVRHFIDLAKEQGDLGQLYMAAALFLGVGLSIHFLTALTEYLGEDVAWRATNRLRSDVVLHVLSLDMSFHNVRTPGELIERIDGDIERLSNFFSEMVVSMLGGVLMSVGILVVLWVEDWRLAESPQVRLHSAGGGRLNVRGWPHGNHGAGSLFVSGRGVLDRHRIFDGPLLQPPARPADEGLMGGGGPASRRREHRPSQGPSR